MHVLGGEATLGDSFTIAKVIAKAVEGREFDPAETARAQARLAELLELTRKHALPDQQSSTAFTRRYGLAVDAAQLRIDAQAPLEKKIALADYVIDSEGTLRETHRQVERVYRSLLGDFEREFGMPRSS